jgi:hypothetical protein
MVAYYSSSMCNPKNLAVLSFLSCFQLFETYRFYTTDWFGYQRASKQEEITPPKEEQRTDELSQSVSTWIRLKYDWTGCIESNGSDFDQREVLGYHKDSRSWHPCQRLINLKRKKTSKKVYPTYTGLRAIVFKSPTRPPRGPATRRASTLALRTIPPDESVWFGLLP